MIPTEIRKYQKYLIAAVVGFFALFTLWIRLIPMVHIGQTDILSMVAMDDPLYNLRQVEVMLAQFPGYAWFDPMTLYPEGSAIYWGPLFPTIIAICCLITGASTRPEIISMALLVPPLLAAAVVIIMYYAGRVLGDWKTGLLAAAFTAIISGQILTYSFYGYIDHHIAEVLFSTLFCVTYCSAIISEKDQPINLKDVRSYQRTLLLAVFSGIAYLLGLLTMPTIILFAMILALFSVIQFVIDFYRGRTSEYLLVVNCVTFAIATAGLLAFGFKSASVNLSSYSIAHIYAYLGLIGGTCLLYALARTLRGKPWYWYPGAIAGIAVLSAAILYIVSQPLYMLFVYSLYAFFGQMAVTNTVQEAMGWSVEHAWYSFNYGLLLFFGGILVILYRNIRDEHPHQVFALIWALVMLLATWQHIRYEYYLAICISLLSALCVGFVLDLAWNSLSRTQPVSCEKNPRHEAPVHKKGAGARRKTDVRAVPTGDAPCQAKRYLPIIAAVIVAGLAVLFVYTSVSLSYSSVSAMNGQMIPDWKEALEWMGNNTPDTGVDYLTIYDPSTFHYPTQSYGVLSWWDYGHMITYIAKRIPNANPFQQGVAGNNGSATYFMTTSEDNANAILDNIGTRYVVTDILMDDLITGKFYAMATWHNSTEGLTPYVETFYYPTGENASSYQLTQFIRPDYYLTMVSRLHTFDGSMTTGSRVYFLTYAEPAVTGEAYPVITNGGIMDASAAQTNVTRFNAARPNGYHAGLYSTSIVMPAGTVPALRHYRLVHESPKDVVAAEDYDIKYVKVFEYVKGARIQGAGIISIPLVTDTGRHFTYRQESINGEFVVPYSTSKNPYGVKAEGLYTIEGTSRTFEVPETAVMQGTAIN